MNQYIQEEMIRVRDSGEFEIIKFKIARC